MPPRDSFTFPKLDWRLDTMNRALKESQKRPLIGVTQGGSSRKWSGSRPAATNGLAKPARVKSEKK